MEIKKGINISIFTYFFREIKKFWEFFNHRPERRELWDKKKRWESRPNDRDVGTVGSYPHKTSLPYLEEKSESEFFREIKEYEL